MPWDIARLEIIAEKPHDVRETDEQVGDVLPIGIASRRPGIIEISLPRPARTSLVRIKPRSEAVLLHDLHELDHAREIDRVRCRDLSPGERSDAVARRVIGAIRIADIAGADQIKLDAIEALGGALLAIVSKVGDRFDRAALARRKG